MTTTTSPSNVAVCVATFRRPDLLRTLLESLEAQQRLHGFSVFVVDNDPERSAAEVAGAFDVHYSVEEEPGIVAARNRALSVVRDSHSALVFVDDDEWVSDEWFESLLNVFNSFDADAVLGPVEPVFSDDCPRWVIRGGFMRRPRHSTGDRITYAATNNVMVRLSAIQRLRKPGFDPAFSTTGGSDAELFWRLNQAGGTIRWCDEAIVFEHVPIQRANVRWLWRRNIRLGNVSARLRVRSIAVPAVVIIGAARAIVGGIGLLTTMCLGAEFVLASSATLQRVSEWSGPVSER